MAKDSTTDAAEKRRITDSDSVTETPPTVKEALKHGKHAPPKSRKELRAEKKAAKKAASAAPEIGNRAGELSKEETRTPNSDKRRASTMARRKEKRLAQIKRLRRETTAPTAEATEAKTLKRTQSSDADAASEEEDDIVLNIYNHVFNSARVATTGTTTLRLGVEYVDVVEGTGLIAEAGKLVRVRYKLQGRRRQKGGDFGAAVAIDSSKGFYFRLGAREVIAGWDIGVVGMREGGRRHLVVPPKAGYGVEDIGAGVGATLFFDITLLKIR